jgi:signal transduction histidine kinase
LQDLGHSVGFEGGDRTFYTCRRVSLKRAFTNLIDNAVKYGGTARVSLARRGATIIVEIDDDGPGIPEDRHEEIFMPFYRLDESRSPEAGGTGLGLSIAQAVVQGHGGDIGLVNRAGGGLRVRVTLPL